MLRVGLTGGIGSGKSTVSSQLARLGAEVIDYDLLAREVVAPGQPALERIADRFGTISADGELDRPALAAIVFADENARRELEAITHPAISAAARDREEAAGLRAIVVHDNPLLIEMGTARHCDVVVVVDVPIEIQIERLVDFRGMTPEDAAARIAAQTSRDERLAAADLVISNAGTPEELASTVNEVWRKLCQRAPRIPTGD